ncbi:DUF397 domain-containing protein [Embleya sp. NPDC059259]|uniref:DUF397 domain-containing protein n=1 Tax=unclassified Embleya TaxID=2699296 RepID=UPI0036C5A7AA
MTNKIEKLAWRTSSHSQNDGGCVAVAPATDAVWARDSRVPMSPALVFPEKSWAAMVDCLTG